MATKAERVAERLRLAEQEAARGNAAGAAALFIPGATACVAAAGGAWALPKDGHMYMNFYI